jgi:CRP/FNR family transcriptional regulator, anaerobic regulatory protein
MSDSARFALHRPEFLAALVRGEEKIARMMQGSSFILTPGETLIETNTEHEAYAQDSDIATRCIWQVMEEERRLHSWIDGLGQGSAEERLALLLIDFRGRLALSGSIAADSLTFEMPLTQSQLADHLGITAVHVNRVLRAFRERGIATVRDGHVTIADLDELTRRASPLLDAHQRATSEYGSQRSSQVQPP